MLVHRYPALVPATQPETSLCITPRMWRRLLTRPLIAPGSSVLVAGEHSHDAIDLLVDLAFDVTALCTQPADVLAGRRSCPQAEFQLWRPTQRTTPPTLKFDVALAWEMTSHTGNLYSVTARQETAHILASLKPSSRLVILASTGKQACHSADCWARHLACFPGETTTELLTDGWMGWLAQHSLSARLAVSPVLAITVHTPEVLLSAEEWQRYARTGLLTGRRSCCEAAAATAAEIINLPRAA